MIDNDGKYVVVIKNNKIFTNSITCKLVAYVQETGESLSKLKITRDRWCAKNQKRSRLMLSNCMMGPKSHLNIPNGY